jgi:hypothetical protein
MGKHAMEGVIAFLSDDVDSMTDAAGSWKQQREKEVEKMVRPIGFKGKVGPANGMFSEGQGITYSWRVARDSYIAGLMVSAIQFAAAAVECAINHDQRMQNARKHQLQIEIKKSNPEPSDWLTLSYAAIRTAKCNRLPAEELLGPQEKIDTGAIEFVDRRNRIAHGDYRRYNVSYALNLSEEHRVLTNNVNGPGLDALDQLRKCSGFLVKWVKQKPTIVDFFS